MRVHLVDGTYELFRCFHGAPRATHEGREVGAARGLLATLVSLVLLPEVTHVAIAFDSVVAPPASPRTTASAEALIGAQAPLAAAIARALGITMWPSGRYQADEVIATAAARFAADPAVEQVVICATDHDFHQCVQGDRVVLLDRSRGIVTDEAAVRERIGVAPGQIPDQHALVGDRSDGLPGLPGWGPRAAAALLGRYGTVEAIPLDEREWDVAVRGAAALAAVLRERREETLWCRDLAVLRTDLPLRVAPADLAWRGPDAARLAALCATLGDDTPARRLDSHPPIRR